MTNKMTYKNALAFVLSDEMDLPIEVRKTLTALQKQLEKKSASRSSKPTKVQAENATYKTAIVEYLTARNVPMTISEMMENIPALSGLKNQRISALVTQLKNDGIVVRTMDSRKAYFSIAVESDEEPIAVESDEEPIEVEE